MTRSLHGGGPRIKPDTTSRMNKKSWSTRFMLRPIPFPSSIKRKTYIFSPSSPATRPPGHDRYQIEESLADRCEPHWNTDMISPGRPDLHGVSGRCQINENTRTAVFLLDTVSFLLTAASSMTPPHGVVPDHGTNASSIVSCFNRRTADWDVCLFIGPRLARWMLTIMTLTCMDIFSLDTTANKIYFCR